MLYNIMVQSRMDIITGCGIKLMQCLTIATRYAVCRRQFKTVPGQKSERKLMDYQTHMQVIGSNLATAYVLMLMRDLINDMMQKSNEASKGGNFDGVDPLHHYTSGIKAIASEYAYFGIDELR